MRRIPCCRRVLKGGGIMRLHGSMYFLSLGYSFRFFLALDSVFQDGWILHFYLQQTGHHYRPSNYQYRNTSINTPLTIMPILTLSQMGLLPDGPRTHNHPQQHDLSPGRRRQVRHHPRAGYGGCKCAGSCHDVSLGGGDGCGADSSGGGGGAGACGFV